MSAKTLAFVFGFALPLLLVRVLTVSEFGIYKQVFLIVNTAMSVLPLGFAMSAFYFLPRETARKGQVVLNILVFYLFIGLVASLTFFVYPQVLVAIFNAPDLVEHAPLIGAVVFLWVLSSFFEWVSVANGEAGLASALIVIAHFMRTLLLLAAAVWFTSLRSLIYAALIYGVFQTILLLLYLGWRFKGFWRGFDRSLMRSQLAYALPLGFADLFYSLQIDLHNYFISNRFGPAAYAIYAVGCFELPLLAILRESVGSVMIARVSVLRSKNQLREIVALTARMGRKLAAVFFPTYAFLLVVGRELLMVLFTRQYLDSWPIFAVNLTLIPLSIVGSASGPVLRAYPEHIHFLLKTRVALFIPLLGGLWLGTGHFGLLGAISVVVAVHAVEMLIVGGKVARILELSWQDLRLFKDMGKLALASVTAAAMTMVVRELMLEIWLPALLVLCGAVFASVYGASVFFLGVLTPAELQTVRRAATRLERYGLWKKAADSPVLIDD